MSGMSIPLKLFESQSLPRQGLLDLITVRSIIAIGMISTSMYFSDINGTTVTTSETIYRWLRRGTLSLVTLKVLAVILGWTDLMRLALSLNGSL